jgi:HlyD family secretion protein
MKVKQLGLLIISALLLLSCSNEGKKEKKAEKSFEVKQVSIEDKLYFNGTIQPLSEYSLSSTTEAVIEKVYVQYGQWVKKGEIILSLNSSALQKQYSDTLTEYLKAKDNFNVVQSKFEGTTSLWQAGLIARNNYLSEKSNLDNARINLMQASNRLLSLLKKMDGEAQEMHDDLYDLSFEQFDKVRNALHEQHNMINIRAPVSGILLYPTKSNSDSSKNLIPGHAVKSDEVIGFIGDLNGLRIEVDVPEVDIDKVHPGMKASIRGASFGQQSLIGQVISVNSQASENASSGLPSFKAMIEVKSLSQLQKQQIKVGMSASVELISDKQQGLLVPLDAIKQQDEQLFVEVEDKNSGKRHRQLIHTGSAHDNMIVVQSGLKAGDLIRYG